MSREKYLSLLSLLAFAFVAVGQQDPQFSQNMFNQMSINPAYAGSNDMICATAINRMQWVGFGEGTPGTTVVNLNAAMKPFGLSSGIGLNIQNDRFGFNKDLGINLSYAARFNIEGAGTLAIGVNGGFINNVIDPSWQYPTENSSDNAIPSAKDNSMAFDMGAGVFFSNNEMYFGASATHLNQPKFNKAFNPSNYRRHYYLTGGYVLQLRNPVWELNPSVFIGSDLITSQFTVTTNFIYNKKFWGGVSYRIGEAFTAMVGFELFNGMRIGYAFDFSTTDISRYNSGSHEFMLGYCFSLKKEKPPQQYKSIRFL